MTPGLASALMPLMRLVEPETAHGLSLKALRRGWAGRDATPDDECLAVEAFGRRLRNPIGLAAGFDKDAVALNALGALGFGFVEVGTVTPLPQAGNPRPRLFRLRADEAVINRMGFNNAGIDVFLRNLGDADRGSVAVGANVGINKEGAAPLRDYPMLVEAVSPFADYITINISSPNTPNLRDLQSEERLIGILDAVKSEKPVFVKIAPDLNDDGLASVIEVCAARGVAGLIISNTTIARPDLKSAKRGEAGGLSGRPLFVPSTKMLARAYKMSGGRMMLIGVGGVASAEDAFAKILAGASLVQVYTGFAYAGPVLIPRMKLGLARLVRASGLASINEAVGALA
jgi:dihydroorotate dehydrogenase